MESESFDVLDTCASKRKLHLCKIYRDMGEVMVRIKELVEISDAAEMFEYAKRIEFEMENYQKRNSINKENKLTRDILLKEVSKIENDLDSLKVEYSRLKNDIDILLKEKKQMEIQSKKLKQKHKTISNSLNEIRSKISKKYEEIDHCRNSNENLKREIEDLELAITLEEGTISEKKKELKSLEVEHARKEMEKKRLIQQITETARDLEEKSKFRDLIEKGIKSRSINEFQDQPNEKERSSEDENLLIKKSRKIDKIARTSNRKLSLPSLNFNIRKVTNIEVNDK